MTDNSLAILKEAIKQHVHRLYEEDADKLADAIWAEIDTFIATRQHAIVREEAGKGIDYQAIQGLVENEIKKHKDNSPVSIAAYVVDRLLPYLRQPGPVELQAPKQGVWHNQIVAERHEVSGNWVLWYLTDAQAAVCSSALEQYHLHVPSQPVDEGKE